MAKKKTGKSFEGLVTWIQQSLHSNAEVKPNDKIRNIHTKRKRQIDVSIRLSDGPTEFLGIVEVKDHKRPIGVSYIEALHTKRESVAADAAFIVSKSGFCGTAIKKANELNIRTMTYEEATESNWSGWLVARTMQVYRPMYENSVVYFFEAESNAPIKVAPELMVELNEDPSAKIMENEEGERLGHIPSIIHQVVNSSSGKPFEGIEYDGKRHKRKLISSVKPSPPLYIRDEEGKKRLIGKIGVGCDMYREVIEQPIKLNRFKRPEDSESLMEVAESIIPMGQNQIKIEMGVPGAGGFVKKGTEISVRVSKMKG